ncbi:MAG: hypothetical protein QNK37_30165 [Acidobacteriota bacterium]|nr:hypothetical protein [Acidobacteriota bacterium]
MKRHYIILIAALLSALPAAASGDIPFTLSLDKIEIPVKEWPGVHSFSAAEFEGKFIVVGGRTNGLHGFPADLKEPDAFPKSEANRTIYILDLPAGTVLGSQTTDALPKRIAQHLRATNPQYYADGNWLYIVGGYGESFEDPTLVTLPYITVLDLAALTNTILNGGPLDATFAAQHIGFNANFAPAMVTGGELQPVFDKAGRRQDNLYMLVFGQEFQGKYTRSGAGFTQEYLNRVHLIEMQAQRRILSVDLTVKDHCVYPDIQTASNLPPDNPYHRRDLTVAPSRRPDGTYAVTAYGGVFKNDVEGYLEPIYVQTDTTCVSLDEDTSAKQLMSQYNCAVIQMFDDAGKTMYSTFMAGISYYYWNGTGLVHDTVDLSKGIDGLPFIDSITTLKVNQAGTNQYLHVGTTFPPTPVTPCGAKTIRLGGAETHFVPSHDVPVFANGVINLNAITTTRVLGYLIGGIGATEPYSINGPTCSSPEVYRVVIQPSTPQNTVLLQAP